MNNLSKEESGANHREEKAQRIPDSEEDRTLHLHAPGLKVAAHPTYHKSLLEDQFGPSVHKEKVVH